MTRELVFVHGRSQEDKDASAARDGRIAAGHYGDSQKLEKLRPDTSA